MVSTTLQNTQNIVYQRSTRTSNTTATVKVIFWIIYNVQSTGQGHLRTNAEVVAVVEVAAAVAIILLLILFLLLCLLLPFLLPLLLLLAVNNR